MKGTWHTGDCGGGGGGGGGLVLVVIGAAVVIGSGGAAAIASALVTIAIIVGVVLVLAVSGVVALLVYRARQDRPGRPIAAPVAYQLPPESRPQLEESHNRAIEPPRETHLHFHVSAAELAAIMRQHYTEE